MECEKNCHCYGSWGRGVSVQTGQVRLGTYQVLVRLSDCGSVRGCNWSLC
jgi:hypothetical protein